MARRLEPKVEFRRCNKCTRIRPLTDFHKLNARLPSGKVFTHRPECKDCRNGAERQRYAEGRRSGRPRLQRNIASTLAASMSLPTQPFELTQAGVRSGA